MRYPPMLLGMLALGGCAHPPSAREHYPRKLQGHAAAAAPLPPERPSVAWSPDTRSPNPGVVSQDLSILAAQCGELDARLNAVAAWLALRGSVGGYANEVDQLTFALRAAGTPYVWPAAWSRSWRYDAGATQLSQDLSHWLTTVEQGPHRRCGLARLDQSGQSMLVAVVSMVLADLVLPLPTQTRVGQWLDFQAKLRIEASQAKVILLGPTGEPASIPTQQAGPLVRARFAAISPGPWLVQLLASGATGPRPMLEAMLFVDVPQASNFQDQPVPGEEALRNGDPSEVALDRMVTAMRRRTGRPAMRRDPTLDRLALEHAGSMSRSRRIGHDVGQGPTHERLARADFQARLAGENVAHAADAARAHRALWASPSHRSNLLHRGFARWGLGVVRDDDGSLWICELFASGN